MRLQLCQPSARSPGPEGWVVRDAGRGPAMMRRRSRLANSDPKVPLWSNPAERGCPQPVRLRLSFGRRNARSEQIWSAAPQTAAIFLRRSERQPRTTSDHLDSAAKCKDRLCAIPGPWNERATTASLLRHQRTAPSTRDAPARRLRRLSPASLAEAPRRGRCPAADPAP
jgi:hypothetical protein